MHILFHFHSIDQQLCCDSFILQYQMRFVDRHKHDNLLWFLGISPLNIFNKVSCLPDNVDLGTACGKYYRVCCLSIIDPGIYCILKENLKTSQSIFCISLPNCLIFWCFQVILILSRQCLVNTRVALSLFIFWVLSWVFII